MARVGVSVLLILVCVIKCLAMNHHDLEDFANFLKKTSQLSPTLKKGAEPDYDYDEDEPVSDHAWEESGKFEGDLVLNERQRRLIVEDVAEGLSRNGIRDGTKRWPNNEVIYFIQREHFTSDQVQAIQSGIDDLARASCVTFRPYKKGDRDAVVIQGSRRGCFSQVGYQSGYQVLNLSGRHPVGRGCFRHGTVVHELLHTLGFYHMQSSPDRDDYVNVIWENIVEPARHNFRKYNLFAVTDFGVGYDYDSVLHYSRRAFSVNGQDTIVPKKSGTDIGQRIGLSDKDAQKLNKMYCDADSDDQANQQTDEEATAKTEVKKNIKNKPFEGHGIGYHQGKAVAIKLLPAAETYKLPDVPSFHVFDYFSKTPQALPPPENQGFRIGKEIDYTYHPPEPSTTEEHSKPILTNLETISSVQESYPQTNDDSYDNFGKVKNEHSDKANTENGDDTSTDSHQSLDLSETLNDDLVNAFDRLSKIIKHHVYPSQTPNLDIYKKNKDSNRDLKVEGYNQAISLSDDDEERKEDKKTAVQYIQGFYDKTQAKPPHDREHFDTSKKAKDRNMKKPHSYSEGNFELSDPYYESFPIYKQFTNNHYTETEYPAPQAHRQGKHRNRNEDTRSHINEEKSNARFEGPDTGYADYTPQYNTFSDHDSESDNLFIKSNGSAEDDWRDPRDRRNKNNRYSTFYGASPDYSLFGVPVKFDEDWYGTYRRHIK